MHYLMYSSEQSRKYTSIPSHRGGNRLKRYRNLPRAPKPVSVYGVALDMSPSMSDCKAWANAVSRQHVLQDMRGGILVVSMRERSYLPFYTFIVQTRGPRSDSGKMNKSHDFK